MPAPIQSRRAVHGPKSGLGQSGTFVQAVLEPKTAGKIFDRWEALESPSLSWAALAAGTPAPIAQKPLSGLGGRGAASRLAGAWAASSRASAGSRQGSGRLYEGGWQAAQSASRGAGAGRGTVAAPPLLSAESALKWGTHRQSARTHHPRNSAGVERVDGAARVQEPSWLPTVHQPVAPAGAEEATRAAERAPLAPRFAAWGKLARWGDRRLCSSSRSRQGGHWRQPCTGWQDWAAAAFRGRQDVADGRGGHGSGALRGPSGYPCHGRRRDSCGRQYRPR